ncbi:MAG: hexokinase [Kiritimatiellia bacterium]
MFSKVDCFLKDNGLDINAVDREKLLSEFKNEMSAGLKNGDSSLAMIPSFISIDKDIRTDMPVVVLDAGGTNLRTAVLEMKENGDVEKSGFAKCPMPGTREELTNDEFFTAFADFLEPNLSTSNDTIGFCFSYPAEITPQCDAILKCWSKQIKAPGVVGQRIGAGLCDQLEKRGYTRRFVILNDTVATLLAGKSSGVSHHYSAYVGLILGTGTNTAYVEKNHNIVKRPDLDPDGSMVINIESGGFNKIEQSRFDKLLDQRMIDPGAYTFEKMLSGAYLGQLCTVVLIEAAKAGFFSGSAADSILSRDGNGEKWQPFSNKSVDDFCGGKPAEDNPFLDTAFNCDDREIVKKLCTPVYERAAVLTAVNIASAIIKTGSGSDPSAPVCVNVDGSSYYLTITADFKNRVRTELKELLAKRNLHYELIKVEDSPIIGAAVAGLMV